MLRVLKFQASWCQPCKMLSKAFADINTDIPVEEIDIDDKMEFAQEYGIRGVPTLILLDGNTEIKRKSGIMMPAELEEWLKSP